MSKVTHREIVITTRLAQRIALAPSIERALDVMFEHQKAVRDFESFTHERFAAPLLKNLADKWDRSVDEA